MAGRAKSAAQRSTQNGKRDVLSRMRKAWGESPFYQAQLKGPAPDRLLFQPVDPYTPDQHLAQSLLRGKIALGDETVDCDSDLQNLWDLAQPGGALFAYLHEFTWLRHLSALGDEGRKAARDLTAAWLDRNERWSSDTWEPYYVSERLVQLCAHHPLILAGADALWRSRVLTCMARQTRHLARTTHRAESGFDRLMTALGLGVAGYSLPGCEGPAERGLEMARRELRIQLRPDGGHVSRNPSRQLKLALRLQSLTKAIEARGYQAPGFLRHLVQRSSAMAAFFRCADGGLAVFNGGYEDDNKAIIAVQTGAGADFEPADFVRHSGYHKLNAARSLLIVDTANDRTGASAFQSGGSMHFSSGRSRIIVNCGNGGHLGPKWRKALEQRSAHSSLSFEGDASITFGEVAHRRAEDVAGQLLEFERRVFDSGRDGVYLRRLYLSAGGADLRGEELLDGLEEATFDAAVWRFHLHSSIKASLARDRKSVILLAPNKEGWRFKSSGPELSLEKSIYCGNLGAPASSEQIVIYGGMLDREDPSALTLKWALKRLDTV